MGIQDAIKSYLVIALCLWALQAHAGIAPSCEALLNSIHTSGESQSSLAGTSEVTALARAITERLRDPNYKGYDTKVLNVFHFVEEADLKGFRIPGSAISEIVAKLTRTELQKIDSEKAFTDSLVVELIKQIKLDQRLTESFGPRVRPLEAVITTAFLQRAAQIFFGYEYLMGVLPKGAAHYNYREFLRLAKIEGLKPVKFENLYRFDSREIQEITAAKGFFPNPKIRRGLIAEHSMAGVGSFGAGFVSFSMEPGNEFNLNIGPVLMSSRIFSTDISQVQTLFPSSLDRLESKNPGGRIEILKTVEYEVSSVIGVHPAVESKVEGEKEIVTPFVPVENIGRSRNIYILAEVYRSSNGQFQDARFISSKLDPWHPVNP